MNKSELKEIIRETILAEMEGNSKYYPGGKTPGLTKKVMDTILMNIAKGTDAPEKELKEGEEKTYEVTYFYRFGKYGDDKEIEDEKVEATSEAEAIEKVKKTARKGAIQSSFKAELKK
jgi:hypothetical protein